MSIHDAHRHWRALARPGVWALLAVALAIAPFVFTSSMALGMLSQMCAIGIICLSCNMLYGQGGMPSFGHAVYSGLGAFAGIHLMRAAALPLPLVPLGGALAAMIAAAPLAALVARRGGVTFAMISLGVGEMLAAAALMLPAVFGGEGGISASRDYALLWPGVDFAPQRQVYWLGAAWFLLACALMYAFTRTPLGRMLHAVRDNAQRAAFCGCNPQLVRGLAFTISAFFAGLGGALLAIHTEIVTVADSVSLERSASYLLFTIIGGAGFFAGPVIGAILLVLCSVWLSSVTQAWGLYTGLIFIAVMLFAPGGVCGLAAGLARAIRSGAWRRLWLPWLGSATAAMLACAALVTLAEMLYHRQLASITGAQMQIWGATVDTHSATPWLLATCLMAASIAALLPCWRTANARWQTHLQRDARQPAGAIE